ncbi:hypothetical protein AA313_de0210446 [Arthrobotrys entomopaga]|nr:hypothetical protein AA313_de0210446 [Arthrobotrys entomopaga]
MAGRRIICFPELIENILIYLPSQDLLSYIRLVHPIFKDVIENSRNPIILWNTWRWDGPLPPTEVLRDPELYENHNGCNPTSAEALISDAWSSAWPPDSYGRKLVNHRCHLDIYPPLKTIIRKALREMYDKKGQSQTSKRHHEFIKSLLQHVNPNHHFARPPYHGPLKIRAHVQRFYRPEWKKRDGPTDGLFKYEQLEIAPRLPAAEKVKGYYVKSLLQHVLLSFYRRFEQIDVSMLDEDLDSKGKLGLLHLFLSRPINRIYDDPRCLWHAVFQCVPDEDSCRLITS